MPIEPTLSDLFHSADGPDSSRIDVRATIRRSRRARLPRQVAAGAALSLAVVGIGVAGITGVNGFRGAAGASTASDHSVSESSESGAEPAQSGGQPAPGSGSGPASADGVLKRAPVEKLNLCSGQIADVAASATGLQLTVDFADAVAGSTAVSGTATLTNNGTERMVGYTAASPAITLSRDGTVLWHSNGPTIQTAVEVDLDPGESLAYPASFSPVVCGVEDDSAESFRTDLPPALAGSYQVSGAIDFLAEGSPELVTGPLSDVVLE